MPNPNQKKNHFLFLSPENCSEKIVISLTESVYSIGRHSDSNIKLYSEAVSRNHATLIRKDVGKDNKRTKKSKWYCR